MIVLLYPASARGAFRHRHERRKRDAMDAERGEANLVKPRTAKACGPGTPGLVLSLQIGDVGPLGPTRRDLQATVTNKVMDTGESTLHALTPSRREGRMFRLNLW
jgi:hypothetical protein